MAGTISVSKPLSTQQPRVMLRGILYMLAAVLVFAFMDALVKLAAEEHPTGQIIFFRNLFAFIPLYFFIRRAGGVSVLRTRHVAQHVVRSAAGIASMAATFLAFALMPLADVVAIGLSAPIFLTALSVPMLGEQVGWRRWSAVGLGFLGILVITRPGTGVFGFSALIPLGSAALYALAMVQIRKVATREPAATMVFYFTLSATLIGAASLPWQWVTPRPLMLICLIAIGLLGGLAQMALTQAYRLAPVSLVAPFEYVSLPFAALFGYAIWGQVPDRFVWLGAGIVIASGLYILHREAVRRRRSGSRGAVD
jgi:drug/metabolite transporter (DMT)-like permease